jgi:hypothetical protein
MSKHFLNRAQVGAALEQVRRERMPEEMRVHSLRLEPGLLRELAEDQERARARQRTALCVEEELRSMAPVEVRPPAREVAPQRLDGFRADRDDALLLALPDAADEALVEVDAGAVEADRLADS